MNAHDFYSAFVRTAQESTLVTKEMLPSFPEAWGTATFLDLYRNNEPAYTELVNKYIVHKIIKDAGMTPQHEYFRIDTVGWITVGLSNILDRELCWREPVEGPHR